MKPQHCRFMAVIAVAFGLSSAGARAEQPRRESNPKEEAALIKNAEAFVAAFHSGDAKALAAFWTADGDYTDQTGQTMKGRAAIEKTFAAFFAANKGLKLRIDSESLRFVTPDVAIEDGTTAVFTPDGAPPSRARYTIVHVKKDGKWLLSSVRDAPYVAPSNHEQLSGLDWLIGDWASNSQKGEVARVAFSWTESRNFIVSNFGATFKNLRIGGGTQWIGWDPLGKNIRSWTFETNGGFGEGKWTRDGDRWVSKSTGVLREGVKLTATTILTRIDADTISWQAKDRTEDGKPLPDLPPIQLKRVK